MFLAAAVVFVCIRTWLLRLVRGPKHPLWSASDELWAEGARAVFGLSHRLFSLEFQRRPVGVPVPPKVKARLVLERAEFGGRPADILSVKDRAEDAPTVLYLHGGGYVMCSPTTHRGLISRLAYSIGGTCIAPVYRLAPEHPYPAGIDDCLAVYESILADGVAPERLFLAGDSAGGGLVLAVLQRLRAAGRPMPRGAVLFSPWVDPWACGGTLETNVGFDYLQPRMLVMAAGMYAGDDSGRSPETCPMDADLSGLPPLLIQSGEAEIFFSQHVEFVDRLRLAGADVVFEKFPGMIHVFQLFPAFAPSRSALRSAAQFISATVAGQLCTEQSTGRAAAE